MRLSKHAQIRSQQRSLPLQALEVVMKHGKVSHAPGGVCKIFFGNKECALAIGELKTLMKVIERAKGGNIVMGNGQVITVYKEN